MATSEVDIIKKRTKELDKKEKLELIEFLTRSLQATDEGAKQLEYGKYSSNSRRMSSADDFHLAEWHIDDPDLNGR